MSQIMYEDYYAISHQIGNRGAGSQKTEAGLSILCEVEQFRSNRRCVENKEIDISMQI